jgi:hypothetical protein
LAVTCFPSTERIARGVSPAQNNHRYQILMDEDLLPLTRNMCTDFENARNVNVMQRSSIG